MLVNYESQFLPIRQFKDRKRTARPILSEVKFRVEGFFFANRTTS